MLKYLKELLAKRKAKLTNLQKRNQESESLEEVRSLGTEIQEVTEEIRGLEAQIKELETVQTEEENRSTNVFDPKMALNVVQKTSMSQGEERQCEEDLLSTMEYR